MSTYVNLKFLIPGGDHCEGERLRCRMIASKQGNGWCVAFEAPLEAAQTPSGWRHLRCEKCLKNSGNI